MKTYDRLSKIKFLKKYSFKFLFIAFIGIHIPLIGLIIYLIFGGNEVLSPLSVFISVLLFTLIAAGATLFILNKLLEPIIFAKNSLSNYLVNKHLPNLPTQYTDEVGILLKEIQFSVKSLDELINEKQDMIGLMSHDLKNPLAAVMNYAELIPQADSDEKRIKLKNKILDVAKVQRDIVNSVLELLEREEIIISDTMKNEFNLNNLFVEIKNRYEKDLESKQLSLIIDPNDTNLFASEELILQVISNLVSNAIKFTPKGGTINLTSTQIGNSIQINVTDNGIGFDPNNANTIFDRFTKAKRKGTQGENTTGLGLYLCNKIIERHSGTISAKSDGAGQGSKFTINLPMN